MSIVEGLSGVLIVAGGFFFLAGTAGLLRFPDIYTRLHALTKADNLGLGLVVAGLCLRARSWTEAVALIAIWLVVLLTSATACYLVARFALHSGIPPWRRR